MQTIQVASAPPRTLSVCWVDNVHVRTGEAQIVSDDATSLFVAELGGHVRLGRDVHPIAMQKELAQLAAGAWRL